MSHPSLRKLYKFSPRVLSRSRSLSHAAVLAANEVLYERLFSKSLQRQGIEDRYYPIKSAASYSLLYLILRTITELPVRRVLELGCGQTTLLLSDLQTPQRLDVITLEHDRAWSERIQQQVQHQVRHAGLQDRTVAGVTTDTYGISASELGDAYDLLVIDGPVGKRRKSRWGSLEFIEELLGENFVIIFDDAERRGEQDTIEQALAILEKQGKSIAVGITHSTSSQCLIAGGAFAEAAYF